MKKALLVFCVIVGVANGECPYSCDSLNDCQRAVYECLMENTEKSHMRALSLHQIYLSKCPKEYPSPYPACNDLFQEQQKQKNILEQKISQEQQAAQQKQARYAKCRNGNADACFDIGYEELSKCEEVDCNQTEALTYFSKSCNLKNKVGCFNTAVILEQNLFFKNHTKAQEYYRKSCNMGYEPACFKVK